MAAPLESSIVRFRKSNGAVVGAGFLVSKKHVLTCAHVVADALGIARDTQDSPTEDVYLDFPLVDSETQLTARVVFWSPVPPKGSTSVKDKEDIAGLELESPLPKGVQPVKLIIEEDLRGHSFRTFGFPAGHDDGLEATGVLRGSQGTGWVQLEDVKQTGVRLEPGFSGAPVWDEKLKGVVGMAVAADQKRPEAKVAFMIPTRVLATAWKDLDKLTTLPIRYPRKCFQIWRDSHYILASIVLLPLLGGVYLVSQKDSTLSEINQCKTMSHKQEALKKIVIANFYHADANTENELPIEMLLLDKLQQNSQEIDKVEVCLANQTVSTNSEAQILGEELKATIVIWGRKYSSSFDVQLKGIEENIPFLNSITVSAIDAADSGWQTQNLPEITNVMAAFGISLTYYLNGQMPIAREVLEAALEIAEKKRIHQNNKHNAEKLAEAYYILGTMFDVETDSDCVNTLDACTNALKAYRRASELNVKPYQALLNKGILHEKLKEPDAAIEAYTKIIDFDPKSFSSVVARFYRANINLDRKKYNDAMSDLEIVCQREPENPEYRHFLGLAQLQAGQVEKAKQSYLYVKRYIQLQKELKEEILEDLNIFAKEAKSPNLVKVVREITSTL